MFSSANDNMITVSKKKEKMKPLSKESKLQLKFIRFISWLIATVLVIFGATNLLSMSSTVAFIVGVFGLHCG